MDRFMTQVKAVFPAASLRAATAPEIPADPAVVMSREHLHISWAILGNFVSNHSKFHARSKDPSAKDDDTASDSQSEASRDMGVGGRGAKSSHAPATLPLAHSGIKFSWY